jgi:hypothetical protein
MARGIRETGAFITEAGTLIGRAYMPSSSSVEVLKAIRECNPHLVPPDPNKPRAKHYPNLFDPLP